MRETVQAGGLAAYLVLWKWDGLEEWRLHPVESLKTGGVGSNLLFMREEGRVVNDYLGWPDWLEPVNDLVLESVSYDQRAA
jgi:hypothetical protein